MNQLTMNDTDIPPEVELYITQAVRLLSGQLAPDQEADAAMIEICSLQDRITAIVEVAARKIADVQKVRHFFICRFAGSIRDHALQNMPLKANGEYKRKYYRTIGGATVWYRSTGGVHRKMNDIEYEEWLQALSVQELRGLGGKFTLPVKARNEALKAGLVIPGFEYVDKDEFGKVSFGTEKAFSLRLLYDRLKASLGDVGMPESEEGEEE